MLAEFNREVNKAFCGFFDQSKHNQYENLFLKSKEDVTDHNDTSRNNLLVKLLLFFFFSCSLLFDIILK